MIIKSIEIEKFRAFENVSFNLGKRITAICGRNATQKTTVLGMIGQPFTISNRTHPMYGCKTIDGYNFRSQFKEKFKISPQHDFIGEHKWKLNLYRGIYEKEYFSIKSIARNNKGKTPTLRFWNAESRAQGAGYIQLPVYFLSLSRLFPIGETGKTQSVQFNLTEDELNYCIKNYRKILSIHNTSSNTANIGLEKGGSSKVFAGISDDNHDIFTNSAGESNITKIILAVLSFKKLKEQYNHDYKGGILLIDEIDATLYGFSQKKLIEYLLKESEKYRIQVIFTTHSPIIIKQVNGFCRKERRDKGINNPLYTYDSSIVYLNPCYKKGKRTIMPQNISSSEDLNTALNDINLTVPLNQIKPNIYCEDKQAIYFLQYILSRTLNINLEFFMNFIDINLGWPNYIQLAQKQVPEFLNNIIVLDGDVPTNKEYKRKKNKDFDNFLFLPLVIEKNIFELLKNYEYFSEFKENYISGLNLNYDICFRDYPLDIEDYHTTDFKNWYNYISNILGNVETLFEFWCDKNTDKLDTFVKSFVSKFNKVAEKMEADLLPSDILENEEIDEN